MAENALERVRDHWSAWGRKDPFFAVLVDEDKKGNRWDAEEFFATGRTEIAGVLSDVEELGLVVGRDSALDFGCGVGRLTQALCEHFARATGVDIAESMVEHAREHNRFGDRCSYVVNVEPDLGVFADGSFDFVYSNIVLQHIPSDLGRRYIAEFLRVLAPGGVAVVNCPSRFVRSSSLPQRILGGIKESARTVANGVGERLGYIPFPRMEMHGILRAEVETLIADSGGRLVKARLADWGAVGWENYTYTIEKS